MSEPILLILDELDSQVAAFPALFQSLERLEIPVACFPIRERGTASGNGVLRGSRLLRWTDDDPALRWQSLQNLLDKNQFQAVGFVGARALERLGQRVAEHVVIPCFAYLGKVDLRSSLSERTLWTRGLRHLRLVLVSDKAMRCDFENLVPPPHPYRVSSLEENSDWPGLFLRPLPKSRTALSTLITPVFNRAAYTMRCAESVLANTSGPFEWMIIDNGSTDSTPKDLQRLERRHKSIRVIRNAQNLGFARAVNQGLRRARGSTLVILNNDTLVPAQWLTAMQSALDRDPGLGAVGPCTNEAVDPPQHQPADYSLSRFDSFATAWSLRHAGRVQDIHRLIGFCMAIRRSAYEQVGLLDERFHIGGYEDFDYCLRLRQAGWRLGVAEEAYVHHFGHVSFKDPDFWRKTIQTNRDLFLEKWTRKSLEFLDNISDLKAS